MRGRRRAATILLAVACVAGISRGAGAEQAAPGVEFVADLRDALSALPPSAVPRDDPQLARVRAPLTLASELPNGSAAVAPVLVDLDRDPADVDDARARLQTLIAAVQLPAGSVASDPGPAQQTLHDVYRQDQFAGLGHRASNDDLFSRIGRALLDFIRWLTRNTVGNLGLVPTLIIVGLVLAALLFFILRRLQNAGVRGPGRGPAAEPGTRGVDSDDEWRMALVAAREGAHRHAVRHAFRSALLAVAEKGRLQVDAALTTSELLARARGDADLVAALAPAADSFDRAWYSGRPVSLQDWEVARERCAAVRTLVGRRAVTA